MEAYQRFPQSIQVIKFRGVPDDIVHCVLLKHAQSIIISILRNECCVVCIENVFMLKYTNNSH